MDMVERDAGSRMRKIHYSLYDRMLQEDDLRKAFKKVKSSRGAAGIDRQSIGNFAGDLNGNLSCLLAQLREKSYRPLPVRRVEIPKDSGGMRKLGIPAVRDRVVQQMLLNILQPIFDPHFHPSSFGYRPGRSAHQAIGKAELFIRRYGRKWVVDMDLERCFDTLEHDIIIRLLRRLVRDGSILELVKMFLESGVKTDEGVEPSDLGSPQGGVISPLLMNIVLDEFDQFMKKRGHRIVRYADDILILCCSKSGARNALEVATGFLEGELRVRVNRVKTQVRHTSRGVDYLGVTIRSRSTSIQLAKVVRFKDKVRAITKRNTAMNLEMVIKRLNPVIRGFANYFRVANCVKVLRELAKWIRRRLRCKQLALWKKPKKLHRRLRQAGWTGSFDSIQMQSWRNSKSQVAAFAIPNRYLAGLGLYDLKNVECAFSVPLPKAG